MWVSVVVVAVISVCLLVFNKKKERKKKGSKRNMQWVDFTRYAHFPLSKFRELDFENP